MVFDPPNRIRGVLITAFLENSGNIGSDMHSMLYFMPTALRSTGSDHNRLILSPLGYGK